MFYVSKRYGRSESRVGDFSKEQDAINFIMEKLQEDRHFKLMAVYCLYEGADLLKEYTQDDIATSVKTQIDQQSTGSSASQRGSGQSFAPTPLNTAPRLGPQTWVKDVPKDEDDKDKE